jgi:hypothetical protein
VRVTGGSRGRKLPGNLEEKKERGKKYQGVLPICSFFDGATFFFFFFFFAYVCHASLGRLPLSLDSVLKWTYVRHFLIYSTLFNNRFKKEMGWNKKGGKKQNQKKEER